MCLLQRGSQFYGTFDFTAKPFDWGKGYSRPAVPAGEYVVYEVPLRTFTASPSSGLPAERRGTFLGFMDKARPQPDCRHTSTAVLSVQQTAGRSQFQPSTQLQD